MTSLQVGTVDVPSGIDVTSLTVCVVDSDGGCGPNLAPAADPHGVVDLPLASPLSDPTVEVRASVSDLASNVTVVQRTVAALLDAPVVPWDAGNLPPLDAGVPSDGGTGGGGGGGGGSAGGMGGGGGGDDFQGGCGCGPGGGGAGGLALLGWALLRLSRRRAQAR